jgi:hypothetical protein
MLDMTEGLYLGPINFIKGVHLFKLHEFFNTPLHIYSTECQKLRNVNLKQLSSQFIKTDVYVKCINSKHSSKNDTRTLLNLSCVHDTEPWGS